MSPCCMGTKKGLQPGLQILLLASWWSLSVSAVGGTYVGGAFIASPLIGALIQKFRETTGMPFDDYNATLAVDGRNSFSSGKYLVGITDVPMPVVEEKQLKFPKYTVPLAYTTFSFVTKVAQSAKLSPGSLVGIFRGGIRRWQEVRVKTITRNIVPVVRSDQAGLVRIITTYLHRAAKKDKSKWQWPATAIGEGPFADVYGSNAMAVQGNTNMGKALQSTPGAIGYMQTGVAVKTYGLYEVSVKNRAGFFHNAQVSGNPSAALPRDPPPLDKSWSAVDTVFKSGPQTYPMVALIFALFRKSYAGIPGGPAVKMWGEFALSPDGQNLASSYFFYALPPSFINKGQAAINTINT